MVSENSCENPSGNLSGGDAGIAGGLDLGDKDSTMVDEEAVGENQSLLGTSDKQRASESIEELDVDITDADVRIGGASELPEIWFSDRVHDEIDSKLAKSMIIRLLGKTIGYRALWNRIMALWNPVGEINLIDLDNEYYLVRFANDEDFQKVLSGGPWVIYGSYLTVQPWSRYFNSAEDHPSHIMVWVRLPKLPYRYYTKSLFKYIAATIGKVVKVDYNTTEGKRGRFARLALIVDLSKPLVSGIVIDGRCQDIGYEGLPTICFKCVKYGHAEEVCGATEPAPGTDTITDKRKPDDLYGPWMQVVNRRRRNVGNLNLGVNGGARKEQDTRGSRFTVLLYESPLEVDKDTGPQQVEKANRVGVATPVVHLDVIDHASALPKRTGDSAKQQRKRQIAQGKSVGAANAAGKSMAVSVIPTGNPGIGAVQVREGVSVASPETVVRASSILNGGKHVAVRIGSEEDSRTTRIGRGRVLPASIRGLASKSGSKVQLGVKGISKVSLKSSKSDDRGALKTGPGNHLNNMVSDLNKAAFDEELWRSQSRDIGDTEEGALDPDFNRSFKLLVRQQKPDIVVIMEPRISGREADRFIRRSGFEFSYRVEANGFSSGIWVLWRDTINIQVLAVSNQYIHALCSAGIERGIERALETSYQPSLVRLEERLKGELDVVLAQEESIWHHKSRALWISQGDRNTSYFHMMVSVRHKRNTVWMLRIENGEWCDDPATLRNHAVSFFRHLFTTEGVQPRSESSEANFRQAPMEDFQPLLAAIMMEEVKRLVFSMEPLKAPGSDGLHVAFYQRNWDNVGFSVFRVVRTFFEEGVLDDGVNQTILVLIPKVAKPEYISQFRPISLCNVIYKIITKLLVCRLRPYLPGWIKDTQASFVPGRQIQDNIIIAQEVMHSMRFKSGRTAWMTIKVDLEKAYDRLEWDYIEETLHAAGLPELIIDRIMYCVRSVTTQVAWNGELSNSFRPSRGIRQGDPLSPYLFVLCMDRFSQAINSSVLAGEWHPIRLARDGPGHKVSISKTQICFSRNCQAANRSRISRGLDFEEVMDLGKYLGVPLLHSRVSKATYSYVLENIRSRLSGWAARTLSLAGRITLAKSVLQAISTYASQTSWSSWFPKGLCQEMEKLIRIFV
ncbi:hypothetical protein GQ457_14G003420 [Hibiscus cannabinus]